MYETSKKAAKNKQRHNLRIRIHTHTAHGNHKPFFWSKSLARECVVCARACVYVYPVIWIFFTRRARRGGIIIISYIYIFLFFFF